MRVHPLRDGLCCALLLGLIACGGETRYEVDDRFGKAGELREAKRFDFVDSTVVDRGGMRLSVAELTLLREDLLKVAGRDGFVRDEQDPVFLLLMHRERSRVAGASVGATVHWRWANRSGSFNYPLPPAEEAALEGVLVLSAVSPDGQFLRQIAVGGYFEATDERENRYQPDGVPRWADYPFAVLTGHLAEGITDMRSQQQQQDILDAENQGNSTGVTDVPGAESGTSP